MCCESPTVDLIKETKEKIITHCSLINIFRLCAADVIVFGHIFFYFEFGQNSVFGEKPSGVFQKRLFRGRESHSNPVHRVLLERPGAL